MTNEIKFDHTKGLMRFCPRRYCRLGVTEIQIAELKEQGIEGILLDLDNTLTGWQSSEVPQPIIDWLAALKEAGFKLCLLSNTRHGERLVQLSKDLDIGYVRRAFKPRKKGFLNAMKELGTEPSKTIMIGDQMFTDIIGGNRVGIYTIMVKPMSKGEFVYTRLVHRPPETLLLRLFRKRGHLR